MHRNLGLSLSLSLSLSLAEAGLNVSSKLNKNNSRSGRIGATITSRACLSANAMHDTIPFLSQRAPFRKLHPARCTRRVRARPPVWIQSRSPCGYRGGRIITVIASAGLRALSHGRSGIPREGIRRGGTSEEEGRKRSARRGTRGEGVVLVCPELAFLFLRLPIDDYARSHNCSNYGVTDCRNKYKPAPLSAAVHSRARARTRDGSASDRCNLAISVDELSLFFGESVVTITSSRFHSRPRAYVRT